VDNLWKMIAKLLRSCGSEWEIWHRAWGKPVESLGNSRKSRWRSILKKYSEIGKNFVKFGKDFAITARICAIKNRRGKNHLLFYWVTPTA
jgi:hypothetical protein